MVKLYGSIGYTLLKSKDYININIIIFADMHAQLKNVMIIIIWILMYGWKKIYN